jgi:phosphate-selective porin OprO/OprP
MALPLSYEDKTKWNRWETKPFSGIFVAAAAIDRQIWLGQNKNNEQQVGDLADYEGGEIRAFRIGMAGTINFKKPWIYTLIVVTHAFDKGYDSKNSDQFTLFDYRLDIPLWKTMSMSVGKQKEPISMQRILLGTQMQMQERSTIVDAVYPVRNIGVALNGTGLNQRISWALGVFNDWFEDSQSFNNSSNQVVGRLTGLAFVNDEESNLLHLGLGIRYDDGKEIIRYQATPEFNQSPVFIDTDTINARNTTTIDLEVAWRNGPFWLSAEYLWNHVGATDPVNPVFNGYYISGAWILTKEMRKYNKRQGTIGPVPVSRSVYQGGPGAWEITARYSSSSFTNGLVQGGEMDIISLGLNWWLTSTFGINLNYRHILLDRYDALGRASGLMGRVVLVLE